MFRVFPTFLAALALQSTCLAAITHVGSTNPLTEGWTLSTSGTVSVSGGLDPVDNSTEQWTIQTPGETRAAYQHTLSLADLNSSDGWTATAILRSEQNSFPKANDVRLELDDGVSRWQITFITGGIADAPGVFLNTPSGTTLLASVPDISTAYNEYRVLLRRGILADLPVAGLNSDDVVDVVVGGSIVATLNRSDSFATDGAAIRFGDNASLGSSTAVSRWNYVDFSTGYHIPEPTTALLALTGLAAMALPRSRKSCQ